LSTRKSLVESIHGLQKMTSMQREGGLNVSSQNVQKSIFLFRGRTKARFSLKRAVDLYVVGISEDDVVLPTGGNSLLDLFFHCVREQCIVGVQKLDVGPRGPV
jgi:hypothetical protein